MMAVARSASMSTLLIVDDEPNILFSLEKALTRQDLRIVTAETGRQGIGAAQREKPDAVLLDMRLPDMSGLDAFLEMRRLDAFLPVVIMTAHATTDTAIEATRRGAFDYLLKPVELKELRQVVDQALEVSRLTRQGSVIASNEDIGALADQVAANSAPLLVGRSPAMQQVYKQIGRVAGQDVNVLITGESGTGKELCAGAIVQYSRRNQSPFVAINAAAIPESLLESELFGHERGAFTGADRRRTGRFELANRGTIFLDEIGDMPLALQAKVLRVLQDGKFERVGGNETITTDVRVIAATNQSLETLISQGRFRQDLYYRLNGFTIDLPALRERTTDIEALTAYFTRIFNNELGTHVQGLAPGVLESLRQYRWPGNVRELQAAVKHAFVITTTDILTMECFPTTVRETGMNPEPEAHAPVPLNVAPMAANLLRQGTEDLYHRIHDEVDRQLLSVVLAHVRGNQRAASQLLGISRTTLRARIESLGVSTESGEKSAD